MTKIRIEHDNSGAAAGWYLERVSDKCPTQEVNVHNVYCLMQSLN